MNTPFDRDRPAPPAQGRASAARLDPASGDFAAKQPVAFTSAALRETGETPAEAARRLGMIDPAFLRPNREEPAAPAPSIPPADALVARREPAFAAAPAPQAGGQAEAALTARRAPEPAVAYAPVAPAPRPVEHDEAAATWSAGPDVAGPYADDPDPRASSAGERMNAALGGAAAGVKAFIAGWRARRAKAQAGTVERTAEAAPPQKLTAREKRWRRRRRRVVFEEALGWVLVPVIVVGLYYALIGGLALFGMSLDDLLEGVQVALTQLR